MSETFILNRTNRTVLHAYENAVNIVFWMAKVENVACTFPQTQEILKYGKSSDINGRDLQIILNLKDALNFYFGNWHYPVEIGTILDYNARIGAHDLEPNPGFIRENYPVRITKCAYKPEPIYLDDAESVLEYAYSKYPDNVERALFLALEISKRQFCCNGNKRTAIMTCNHMLAYYDTGYIYTPHTVDNAGEYANLLVSYYDDCINIQQAIQRASKYLR